MLCKSSRTILTVRLFCYHSHNLVLPGKAVCFCSVVKSVGFCCLHFVWSLLGQSGRFDALSRSLVLQLLVSVSRVGVSVEMPHRAVTKGAKYRHFTHTLTHTHTAVFQLIRQTVAWIIRFYMDAARSL